MLDPKFVLVGALLNLIGAISYVKETIKGKTTPNRVTWFLWALAPMLAFGAQLDKGVGLHALMTFMVGLGPLMVLIASFINSKSTWSLSRLDYLCGALSLIGLLFWLITKEGNYAILLGITADLLAGIPTLVKAYKTPETESSPVFLFACASAVITLLTIKTWTFAFVAFPIYIFAICATLYVLIQFKVGNHIRNRISA